MPWVNRPLKTCIIAQNPITIKAGTFMGRKKNPKKTIVFTPALGNSNAYAPRIPDIAPLAPIMGTCESGIEKA
jgi:hypothetical protein